MTSRGVGPAVALEGGVEPGRADVWSHRAVDHGRCEVTKFGIASSSARLADLHAAAARSLDRVHRVIPAAERANSVCCTAQMPQVERKLRQRSVADHPVGTVDIHVANCSWTPVAGVWKARIRLN